MGHPAETDRRFGQCPCPSIKSARVSDIVMNVAQRCFDTPRYCHRLNLHHRSKCGVTSGPVIQEMEHISGNIQRLHVLVNIKLEPADIA